MKIRGMAGVALLLGTALILSACSASNASVTNLGAEKFHAKTQESGVIILDVRTPGEFSQGHIQGALNINVESATFESEIAKLDKSTSYAVYCQSGRRSGIATETMAKSGFTSLFNLQDGVQSWISAGLPLVTN